MKYHPFINGLRAVAVVPVILFHFSAGVFSGGYAGVDPERLDVVRFPLAGPLRTAAVTIDAGDALFVPFGCWHHVRALTPSISLSMSNFAWACGPAT